MKISATEIRVGMILDHNNYLFYKLVFINLDKN